MLKHDYSTAARFLPLIHSTDTDRHIPSDQQRGNNKILTFLRIFITFIFFQIASNKANCFWGGEGMLPFVYTYLPSRCTPEPTRNHQQKHPIFVVMIRTGEWETNSSGAVLASHQPHFIDPSASEIIINK